MGVMEIPDDLRITVTDIRRAGFCTRGIKGKFAEYNLDFGDFLKNGISAADFLATGDGQALQVVEFKLNHDG